MASAVIGSLRVDLGVNSAAFGKGLKGADKGLKRFSANVAKTMAAAGAAVAAAVAGMAVAIRGSINEADKLGKMAQSIGIPVEELSRLKHVADLSGVSLEGLSTAVGRLSRNMSDVAQGAGAEARRAFEALGISVTDADGKLKSSSAVMTEIAGRFAGMEDGAGKTALAMQLMGRSGADMIPMLNAGADGLKRMMQQADDLGIVITEKTAVAAQAFNDNLTLLGKIFDGIIIQISAHLLPHMESFSAQLVAAANNSDFMKDMAGNLTTALKWVADVVIRATAGIRGMKAELAGLAEGLSLLGDLEFKAARDAWNAGQKEFQRIQQDMAKTLNDLWSNKGDRLDVDAEAVGAKIAAPMLVAEEKVKAAGKSISDEMGKVNTSFASGIQSMNETAGQLGSIMQSVGSTIQSAFSSAIDGLIEGTFKAKEAIASLLKDLGKLLINHAFKSLFSGGSGGGGLGSLFAGFFAGGGTIPRGQFGIVGENGPEFAFGPTQIEPMGEMVGGDDGGSGRGGEPNVDVHLRNVITFDPADMLDRALGTRAGERVLLTFLNQNGGAVRGAIG